MPRRLTLHIGTPKSGTTYLQSVLVRGRRRLAREGILYPGARYLPRQGFNQQPAVYALAGTSTGWVDEDARRTSQAYFRHLGEELARHQHRALVSAESLAFFDVAAARALIDRLGYRPSAVTVLITARDLGRILPSIWQQNVKNGSTQALTPYLESVATLRDVPGTPLWTAFGLPGLVHRWAEIVGGIDRVVLVTSSGGASSDELWNRFADAAEIPRDVINAPGPRVRAVDNVSLTMAQAELIRRLNDVLQADGYSRDRQQRLRGHILSVWMNLPGAIGARRPAVPDHLHDTVRVWASDDVARLEASGVRVVGSLTDLEPRLTGGSNLGESAALDGETLRDVLALIERGRALSTARRFPRPLRRLAQPILRLRAAADARAMVPRSCDADLGSSAPRSITLPAETNPTVDVAAAERS